MIASTRWLRAAVVAGACALVAGSVAGCATRTPPPMPSVLRHPEFLYPAVPSNIASPDAARRIDVGWRYLQNDDLRNAAGEFDAALRRQPALYPARAGSAYVALARREYEDAVEAFNAALAADPRYVPALVGRGQALLALKKDDEALASFEAALAVDPSLADVRRRVDVLRFRNVQEVIERARSLANDGRLDDARVAYRHALEASPESAFLHRELGILERRRGESQAAIAALQRATELDPSDAAAYVQLGELFEQRLDYPSAEASYRLAAEIEPSDELTARIEDMMEKAREAALPPEFHAIPDAGQITRAELAALIGVRFGELLGAVRPRQMVMTDIRNHWAGNWIAHVARSGVIEPFPNHTFQPRARVRRVDLANAVSRLVTLIAARDPALRAKLAEESPKIADLSPGHLNYQAVAHAVASGAMPLLEGERFSVARLVSGAEAVDVIERVRALVRDDR